MTTSPPNRQPEGTPTGGEFAPKNRTESPVSLTPAGRTPFGGYELRGYKSAGQGMEGTIWSATIYRDGKAVLTILNDGNGGSFRFTSKASGMPHYSDEQKTFEAQALKFHPTLTDPSNGTYDLTADGAGEIFAETLVFSAELDKFAKKYNTTREVAVDDHVKAGVITEAERALFASPESIERI